MTDPNTTAAVNRILLRTATKAEPVVERSVEQKAARIAKMRAELIELGYSVVTTEWLNGIFAEMTAAQTKRIAREKAE
jgi:hypothetical protein